MIKDLQNRLKGHRTPFDRWFWGCIRRSRYFFREVFTVFRTRFFYFTQSSSCFVCSFFRFLTLCKNYIRKLLCFWALWSGSSMETNQGHLRKILKFPDSSHLSHRLGFCNKSVGAVAFSWLFRTYIQSDDQFFHNTPGGSFSGSHWISGTHRQIMKPLIITNIP